MLAEVPGQASNGPVANEYTRELALCLCHNRRLPAEIAALVGSYFDKRDIFAISVLSRTLRALASAIIYHTVKLDLTDPTSSGPTAVLFLRTLLTSKDAANHVLCLSLCGAPLRSWRKSTNCFDQGEHLLRSLSVPEINLSLSAFNSREVALLWDNRNDTTPSEITTDQECSLPQLCLSIIKLISRVVELRVTSDYLRFPTFRKCLIRLFETANLRNLQSTSFCTDLGRGRPHFDATRDWDQALVTPYFTPKIVSIATVMTLRPGIVPDSRVSTVTRLSLDHFQSTKFDLNALFAATTQLCYLRYNCWVDYSWYTSQENQLDRRTELGLQPLVNSLDHVKASLTELITTIRFTEDSAHYQEGYECDYRPLFAQTRGVAKLTRLHTLAIPYVYLLGAVETVRPVDDWNQVLPTSLRTITWTDHVSYTYSSEDWTDESLMPVITSLLGWLASVGQKDQVPLKFGLKLLSSGEEFNAPVRDSLSKLCESYGITCSIEKHSPDRVRGHYVNWPRGGGASRGRGSPMHAQRQSRGRGAR